MAIVTTDKNDYKLGETAFISTDGFIEGSTVEFQVQHIIDPGEDGVWGTLDDVLGDNGGQGHGSWYVTDGGDGDTDKQKNGSIQTSWFVGDDSLDETFLLTAMGAGEDGAFGTSDDEQATAYFTDSGGAYTLNYAAADPSIYIPPIPLPGPLGTDYVIGGRGDGDPLIPLAEFNDGTSDVRVESLAPQDMALGQIVPFETKITVSGDTTPEDGVITFVLGWNTLTTNGDNFGYDARVDDIGYGVIEAFIDIDTGDGAHVDPEGDAQVDSFTWSLINDEIVGIFTVSGLDDNDSVVLEPWLVLDDTIPAGVGGNVQSRLIDAATGSDQTISVANSGAITLDSGDSINTGNQTVPLLKPSEFFNADVNLSVIKSDNQDTPVIITTGDDPVTGTNFSVTQGDTLTYTIQVTNVGPSVANSVVAYDELDPNVTFVSASDGGFLNTDTGDIIPDGAVQWDVGALAPGEFREYTVTVTVNEDAPTASTSADIINTVTVTTISDDLDPADNTDTEPTDVLEAFVPAGAIAIIKTTNEFGDPDDAGQQEILEGDVVAWTYTVSNAGNVDLSNVVITDDQGEVPVLVSGDDDNDNILDLNETWTYQASGIADVGLYQNVGTAFGDFFDNDGVTQTVQNSDPSSYTGINVAPVIAIVKDGEAIINEGGDTATYTIKLTNNSVGSDPLTITSLTDDVFGDLLSDAETANGGPITLNPGDSFSFSFDREVGLNVDETHINTATVVATDDEGETATADDDHTVGAQNVAPVISVVKLVDANKDGIFNDSETVVEGTFDAAYQFTITADASNVSTDPVTVTELDDDRFGNLLAAAEAANGGNPIVLNPNEKFTFVYTPEITLHDGVLGEDPHINIVAVTVEDDEGTPASDTDDAAINVYSGKGLIAPTNTDVDDYIQGTGMNFEDFYADQNGDVQYQDNRGDSGVIINTNPGVFFYYTGLGNFIKDDGSGEFTVKIDQENQLIAGSTVQSFPLFDTDEVKLYEVQDNDGISGISAGDSSHQVNLRTETKGNQEKNAELSILDGDVTLTYLEADDPNALYVVGIKYNTDALKDTEFANPDFDPNNAPTYNYTFETYYEDILSETDDQGGLNASYKFDPDPDALMLDGEPLLNGHAPKLLDNSKAALQNVVDKAIDYWAKQGADADDIAALSSTMINISDLSDQGDGKMLAEWDGSAITFDDDAAGHGWSIGLGKVNPNGVDGLSALVHEFGHVLGYDHDELGESLAVGDRNLPETDPLADDQIVDLVGVGALDYQVG